MWDALDRNGKNVYTDGGPKSRRRTALGLLGRLPGGYR